MLCDTSIPLENLGRIVVVGAGKAGAGMAGAVERALGDSLVDERVSGWVNVPESCARQLRKIHLFPARPAAVNEPTEAAAEGTERILSMISELDKKDLLIVLLSGGGSALLTAPRHPVTLSDKRVTTQFLMGAGAPIHEINLVRKQLSRVKGGGLAASSSAGCTVALILSDVIGDRATDIASGPTCPQSGSATDALQLLDYYGAAAPAIPQTVFDALTTERKLPPVRSRVYNHIIGNNRLAVAAAAEMAEQLGYRVESMGSQNTGEAAQEGRSIAIRCTEIAKGFKRSSRPVCILSGGEPVVDFGSVTGPGKGGRNQHLALAALIELGRHGGDNMLILAGGTDGEDGPTDAAGAYVDAHAIALGKRLHLDPEAHLSSFSSYTFFEQIDALFKSGPTHTNVADLRVALARNRRESAR